MMKRLPIQLAKPAAFLGVLLGGCNGPVPATAVGGGDAGLSTDQPQAVSLGPQDTNRASPPLQNIRGNQKWAEDCPIPSDAPTAPLGQTTKALTELYGTPAETNRFVLGEALDPIRMSVRNTLSRPADLRREVEEMIWRAQGCELRVWLVGRGGRSVAVQTMRAVTGGEH